MSDICLGNFDYNIYFYASDKFKRINDQAELPLESAGAKDV